MFIHALHRQHFISSNIIVHGAHLLWRIVRLTVEHQLGMQAMHGVLPVELAAEEQIVICLNGSLDHLPF